MTTSLKLRRGTTAQHATFTGAEGEVTVDTTKDTVVVHDGATVGGFPLAKQLSRYTTNVNATTFSNAHNSNVNGTNTDRQIYLFGDSHAWGQGAPEWDWPFGANYSAHSSSLFNKGFMARIASYIMEKCGFDDKLHTLNAGLPSQRYLPSNTANAWEGLAKSDPLNIPLEVQTGRVMSNIVTRNAATSSHKSWYTPFTNDDSALIDMYREKMFQGRFNKGVCQIYPETSANFIESGKTEYVTLLPVPGQAASGAPWVAVTDSNGVVLAEYNGTDFYIRMSTKTVNSDLGFFNAAGQSYFIPGYGAFVLGTSISFTGGYAIRVFAADGVSYPSGIEKYISANMRIYRLDYTNQTTIKSYPQKPFRKLFLGVSKHNAGRKIALFLGNGSSGGVNYNPYGHFMAANSAVLRPQWNFGLTGYPKVNLIDTVGNRIDATPYGVTIASNYIQFDTYAATSGDVVYEIDFGSKVHSPVWIQDYGVGSGGTSLYSTVRGIIYDNNSVTNWAMGGHTIGQWMGDGASYNDGARDHLGDIIEYTKSTPYLVVTELPLVNEYLRQTSIAAFKTNIATFMSRLNGAMNPGGTKVTDFLFFTTLGGKDVEFDGATSSAITYDMYVQAAKEQCVASGAGFLDCRKMIKEMVANGTIDKNRLFADNNHPSSFANELMAKQVCTILDEVL